MKKIDGQFCYLIVYVDDLIVACESIEQMKQIEENLQKRFKIQNLGPIKHYLGMEISKDSSGNFSLCQSNYIKKIATDFGMKDAKPARTPMDTNYLKTQFNDYLKIILNIDV